MPLINWSRLMNQEGDTTDSIPLLPRHRSLLIKMLWFLEDNPQEFIEENVEDIDMQEFEDMLDTIEKALSV